MPSEAETVDEASEEEQGDEETQVSDEEERGDEETQVSDEEERGDEETQVSDEERLELYLEKRADYLDSLAEHGFEVSVPEDSPLSEYCNEEGHAYDRICQQAARGGPADVAKRAHEEYLEVREEYIEQLEDNDLMSFESTYGGIGMGSEMGQESAFDFEFGRGQQMGGGSQYLYSQGFFDDLARRFGRSTGSRAIKSLACQLTENLALPPFLRRIHQVQCQRNRQQQSALDAGSVSLSAESEVIVDAGLQDLANFAVAATQVEPAAAFGVDEQVDENDPVVREIGNALESSVAEAGMSYGMGIWGRIKNVAKKVAGAVKKVGSKIKEVAGRVPVVREVLKRGKAIACRLGGSIPAVGGIVSTVCQAAGMGMTAADDEVDLATTDDLHVGMLYYAATLDVSEVVESQRQGTQATVGGTQDVQQGQQGQQSGGMQTIDIMS
jgi:hypothetical protein